MCVCVSLCAFMCVYMQVVHAWVHASVCVFVRTLLSGAGMWQKTTNKLLGLEKITLNNPVPTKCCTQTQPNSLSMRCVCSQTRGRHIARVESSSVSVHFVILALLMRFQGPVKANGTCVYISYLGASKQVLQAITQQHFLPEKQNSQ